MVPEPARRAARADKSAVRRANAPLAPRGVALIAFALTWEIGTQMLFEGHFPIRRV